MICFLCSLVDRALIDVFPGLKRCFKAEGTVVSRVRLRKLLQGILVNDWVLQIGFI